MATAERACFFAVFVMLTRPFVFPFFLSRFVDIAPPCSSVQLIGVRLVGALCGVLSYFLALLVLLVLRWALTLVPGFRPSPIFFASLLRVAA